jgi:serine/threonine protein phosphatase PrpC
MTLGLTLESAGQSHVGRVRTLNEDAWLARPELGIWAVADGMGGHQRGDVASRMIVDALAALPATGDPRALRADVEAAIAGVNGRLREMGGPDTVIGSTVAMLLVHVRHFAVLWAGDSRVYRATEGRFALVSHDHSLVQDLVDRGEIGREEALRHPLSNVVTRAVGAEGDLVLDAVQGELGPGDLFLLCSDGLTKHLADKEIADLVDGDPPDVIAARLVEATLARGAADNVTVLVVRCCPATAAATDGMIRTALRE